MNEEAHRSFTELEVWKKARLLKIDLRELAATFPADEKFSLTDQVLRSSRNINTAIAEGCGRGNFKEQVHFCFVAMGSLSETYNHLIDALDCYYISIDQLKAFKSKIDEVEDLLNEYISYVKKSIYQ